jgi:thiazole/oxazole-forming peptide maturase SagC family component
MKLELSAEKYRSLTVNLLDFGGGAIIKRGRVELKVAGEDAAQLVGALLGMARRGATREQLLERFPPTHQESVGALIDYLISRRILVPEDSPAAAWSEEPLDVFYWHFDTQTKEVRRRLNAKRISIFGVNYVSRQLAAGLRASGAESFGIVDDPLLRNPALFDDDHAIRGDQWTLEVSGDSEEIDPESLDCIVATSDGGSVEQLRAWNEFAVLHNLQFFPVLLQDLVGYVGPLVTPGETPCFECLRQRQNAHLMDFRVRRSVESAFIHDQAVGGFHPSMASILGDVAAMELTKAFGLGGGLTHVGTVIEVNLLGSEMKPRRVLKLPRCPVCSRLNRAPSTSVTRAMLAPVTPGGDR